MIKSSGKTSLPNEGRVVKLQYNNKSEADK